MFVRTCEARLAVVTEARFQPSFRRVSLRAWNIAPPSTRALARPRDGNILLLFTQNQSYSWTTPTAQLGEFTHGARNTLFGCGEIPAASFKSGLGSAAV